MDKARVGTYTGIANEVTKERLNRFFTIDGDFFRIRKNIREMMIFAPQSVIKDPPFTRLDLISCRNLLIYLSAELQKTILPLFHYSLMTDGMLVLGPSETISGFVDLFSLANTKWKFYKRRDSILSAQSFIDFPMSRSPVRAQEVNVRNNELKNISQLAEKAILQNYSPNCVIVNEKGDIVYIHGRTGKYLELTHGEARMNIFDMAREELQQELTVMIRKVLSSKKPLTVNGLKVRSGGIAQHMNLTVKPIKEPTAMLGSLLVIFEDVPRPKKGPVARIPHFEKNSAKVIKDLEHELKSNKEYLQSAIEELEASNEELKSSNEELQSTNEEIQSANEELQTSKEELQSLNEELITVNTELLSKNDELSVVSNDIKNLFDSTHIPTIFLDNELVVKRFTANTTKVVNLIPSDVGRPIHHIATNLQYDSLISDITTVLRTLIYKETEVQTKDGVWYLMRILPYRTTDNFIDGVVITFSDIHKAKGAFEVIHKLNDDLELAREYADNIVDTVREALLVIDKDLVVISANRPYYKIFNTVKERTVGKHIYEIDDKKWAIPELRQMLEEILPKKNFFEDFEVDFDLTHGSKKRFLLNARQIYQAESGRKLILLAIHDRGINE
ncbi:MAG: PAS domain-containing protein [bacterium]